MHTGCNVGGSVDKQKDTYIGVEAKVLGIEDVKTMTLVVVGVAGGGGELDPEGWGGGVR